MRRELEPDKSMKVPNNHYYKPYIEWLKTNPLRQLMVGANTNGHNWTWRRWKKSPKEGYELHEAKSWDNEENLPDDFIDDLKALKKDSVKKFNRFVLNSWEDYDMEGAFYASIMSDALKDKRVDCHNLFDSSAPVYTFWDLGLRTSDTTAIWFVQFVKNQIWLIDYYENYGEGMKHYNTVLNERAYNYSQHWLPPDAKQRLQGKTVVTRADIMREYRTPKHEQIRIVTPHLREQRIEYTRKILHSCWFSDKCEEGVEALNHYKTEPIDNLSTEGRPSLKPQPLHNWASNGADAFGYMAVTKCEKLLKGLETMEQILPIKRYKQRPRHVSLTGFKKGKRRAII